MSTPSVGQTPFALDGTVTHDKLIELLAAQTELSMLDYKRECDLSKTPGTVELVKDIGAMGILGGYLLVGADDTGRAADLPSGQAPLFDQATREDEPPGQVTSISWAFRLLGRVADGRWFTACGRGRGTGGWLRRAGASLTRPGGGRVDGQAGITGSTPNVPWPGSVSGLSVRPSATPR